MTSTSRWCRVPCSITRPASTQHGRGPERPSRRSATTYSTCRASALMSGAISRRGVGQRVWEFRRRGIGDECTSDRKNLGLRRRSVPKHADQEEFAPLSYHIWSSTMNPNKALWEKRGFYAPGAEYEKKWRVPRQESWNHHRSQGLRLGMW